MTRIWVSADHHFGHYNILRFMDNDGELIRGKVFKDIQEHNEMLVYWHNELVKPEDHVYFLGDFSINQGGLQYATRMNGHKRLVRGNHDIFKTKKYLEVGIDEIYGCRVFQNHDPPCILSHIPIHPDSLRKHKDKQWVNIHGHLHTGYVRLPNGHPDERYRCVSLEHTNYRPVLLME